jgi:hypothetical protein
VHTASGDLRNVLLSIANLPTTFTGHCQIIINDKDWEVVARNAIMLMVALQCEPDIAANAILHLWYSSLVTADTIEILKIHVQPLIDDVLGKITDKPSGSTQSKTWSFGTRKLNLAITKQHWDDLPNFITGCAGMTANEVRIARQAVCLHPRRKDFVDRALHNLLAGWRVPVAKFRGDGILLPFGTSTAEYTLPNP